MSTDFAICPENRESQLKSISRRSSSTTSERMLLRVLSELRDGIVHVTMPDGETHIAGRAAIDDLEASIVIHDARCFRELMLGGSLGAAEAYLQGLWSTDDLTALMRIMCRNLSRIESLDTGWARIMGWASRGLHWLSRNTPSGSKRNIAAHYDLSNDFFSLFLDPTWMYSSGIFERPDMTMEEASIAKLERICQQLELQPGDQVVEIGTGWGGFALHAARNYGCRVTTTTISKQQYKLARQRIEEAGLSDHIQLQLTDYRELQGTYDKLVSIEMIEAVGHEFLPGYFQTCNRLLKPGGRMAIQAITMPDYRYDRYCKSVDFIQRYIFPGGHLPSVGAMLDATRVGTTLQLVDALQFPDSYARTLREWRREFESRLDDVRGLGFDDRLIRMWTYYFCYCEAAFLERAVSVGQFVWEKPKY